MFSWATSTSWSSLTACLAGRPWCPQWTLECCCLLSPHSGLSSREPDGPVVRLCFSWTLFQAYLGCLLNQCLGPLEGGRCEDPLVVMDAFQHCLLGFKSPCFGFSFGRGRSFLLSFQCHLGETGWYIFFYQKSFAFQVCNSPPLSVTPSGCLKEHISNPK